jgi:hypothetical protein
MVTDQDECEGHDEDEEHQGADAESPPGTVVLRGGDLDAVYVEALIPVLPLTAYHRPECVRYVLD